MMMRMGRLGKFSCADDALKAATNVSHATTTAPIRRSFMERSPALLALAALSEKRPDWRSGCHTPMRCANLKRANAISQAAAPRGLLLFPALFKQRAQGMPGARCAR